MSSVNPTPPTEVRAATPPPTPTPPFPVAHTRVNNIHRDCRSQSITTSQATSGLTRSITAASARRTPRSPKPTIS
ncbi:hypothetical protein [Kribbella solani]|uniref:hypothetical protein n=1 Tax=Kribbella solani TaxID=236067 RepID=UPI001EE3A20E